MTMTAIEITKKIHNPADDTDDGYNSLLQIMAARVNGDLPPLFTTTAVPGKIWDAFILNIPADRRQHYTCNCCRGFLQRYAGLVVVEPGTYRIAPALTIDPQEFPKFFQEAMRGVCAYVGTQRITGLFVSSKVYWGVEESDGGWKHLAGKPRKFFQDSTTLKAHQVAAEAGQNFKMLKHAVADYSQDVAMETLRLLSSGKLFRSEKATEVANWFYGVHLRLDMLAGKSRDNAFWLEVANAPHTFCHVRSTIVSTLMDDVKAGVPFEVMSKKWQEKLNPAQYMRPQAPPKEGAIDQAEKIFAAMGLAPALERRYATMDDVQVKYWVPPAAQERPAIGKIPAGVFDDLRAKSEAVTPVVAPPAAITWRTFHETVLPKALDVRVRVPNHGNFYGLVTAVHESAPPILQWDGLENHRRNPVSWYVHRGGSHAKTWGLTTGAMVQVKAIFPGPSEWYEAEKFTRHGKRVLFALPGAVETKNSSLVLFPETMRGELHGVRSVIEAYSLKGRIVPLPGPEWGANGLVFIENSPIDVYVRTELGTTVYKIDRWQ